jgi:hypothetical protein
MDADLPFIPGLTLAARFYAEVVRPIVVRCVADAHAAARLDGGSDVLGYDTPMSRDHGWGPRITIFVDDDDASERVRRAVEEDLPDTFLGYPTRFHRPTARDPGAFGHAVQVTTAARFFVEYVGFDPLESASLDDWLGAPSHPLCTVARGRAFHDGLGRIERARRALQWYPDDLWVHLMAVQWGRIAEEESFMARCGDTGDDLGSRIVAARQAVELMRLAFLIDRQYPPYFKWFGRAFAELPSAAVLTPALDAALRGASWGDRELHLGEAYLALAQRHNALGITPQVDARLSSFHERPYRTLGADRFAEALEGVRSERVRHLPPGIGAVWQAADCTPLLESAAGARRARSLVTGSA